MTEFGFPFQAARDIDAEIDLPKPRVRWHYTTAESLPLILRNHTLWATNIEFLNDTDEIRAGIKQVKRYFRNRDRRFLSPKEQDSEIDFSAARELIDEWEEFPFRGSAFTVSFSRDGDDNSQWDRYAQRDGYAIGIREDSHMPILGCEPPSGTLRGHIEDVPLRWTRMAYRRRKHQTLIRDAVGAMQEGLARNPYPDEDVDMSDLMRDQAVSDYVVAVASIKNRGFRAEREVRYVVTHPDNEDVIHRRTGAYGGENETTFVKLTGAPLEHDDLLHPGDRLQYQPRPLPLPIVKVRLGPSRQTADDVQYVKNLLDECGYSGVKVVKSKSTQR
ncbi:hypothetical protein AS189_18770 [Arthrobacter alpinus]|uniref:DUF2971 domain-containing protein n=1 Tax=Arthrobacter alpinus TaxID=656366 RepID=A0A0S2M3L1_9MICC|nr:hypothetical protein [Arthrobacter alpinus]ALO68166.1 hypothetical protein AS189_18770 [Arthrobacter alpinus]